MEPMQESTCCPLCESEQIERIARHRFTFPGNNVCEHLADATYERLWILFDRILKNREPVFFRSMICNQCGLIFTDPRFSEADLRIKYDAIQELGSVKYRTQLNPPSRLDARARRIHRLVSPHIKPGSAKTRVLDYGGASGYNLTPFVPSCDCGVLDFEQWDLPPGIRYLGKDTADLRNGEIFDVILLLHTLEHVVRPRALITELSRALAPDGILYVEVPLECFREWRRIVEPLTHVNFFSEESLCNCLESCGLSTLHLSSAYQWVTHGKMWCVNIVGGKNPPAGLRPPRPLSTRTQMRKRSYYRAFLNSRTLRRVLRRTLGL